MRKVYFFRKWARNVAKPQNYVSLSSNSNLMNLIVSTFQEDKVLRHTYLFDSAKYLEFGVRRANFLTSAVKGF